MFRGAALIWLGINHRELGNLEKAKQLLEEAAKLNRKRVTITRLSLF